MAAVGRRGAKEWIVLMARLLGDKWVLLRGRRLCLSPEAALEVAYVAMAD